MRNRMFKCGWSSAGCSSDRDVLVAFDKNQALLDRDFQLFYALGDKDVGLTALAHRPIAGENGYFTLLITPKVEIPKRSEERRVGKGVDLGGRRIIKKKTKIS